jgi:hypothetical protein
MRHLLTGIIVAALGSSASVASATDLKAKVLDQFHEQCSAVQMTLITMRVVGNASDPNVELKKGQRSRFVKMADFTAAVPGLPPGRMKWHCGDTAEMAGCGTDATHVRVSRAATGRAATFTCYRVEACEAGQTKLDTLDDRCHAEQLRVGSALVKWRETAKDIPYSSAKLNNTGGVRWTCGGVSERSNCPANTTTLTVERKDRDTGLFHIQCLRSGSQCEGHYGEYTPK